jgi:hypothetical protein
MRTIFNFQRYMILSLFFMILVGCNSNTPALNNNDTSELRSTTSHGNFEAVKFQTEKSSDVNYKVHRGNTSLHYVVARRHTDVVPCLVEEINDVNIICDTSVHYVAPPVPCVAPAVHYVAPPLPYVAPSVHCVAPPLPYVAPPVHCVAPLDYVVPPLHYVAPTLDYVVPPLHYVVQ